ncbi:site-specific integrase [Vibrio cholerae]|uniref:tyrosine-type recombinase/integrase n=1 Tax=Vibrio cholerae TaxID=666 RepID=UPI0021D25730|nr:site-specific integrase [Vibrio cholerae]MCU4216056.1 site-specific integrase [Vibrio cholerae]HCZ9557170.1 site-specific integrase [Vibrio cholerae]HCZ9562687.1 site-specific integrase [Vibrio cholerae]HCZ9571293.1 site-specific integrase [Vibrio cholerae]HCZ9596193.1 site-specific integrase [Vibrio cholerae]
MAITDAWLRATNGKPYSGKAEISHRFGLGVRVSPKGKITWVYRANINGKMQRIKLGEYPAMKLRDAIQARESRAELVELGFDPRKSTRSANDDSIITLNDLIDYWAENHARDNIKQCDALLKMFHTDITPTLGSYPAKQLELIDFMPVFLKAKRRVSAKHSANLMTRFKQVLSYAVRHGLLKYNVLTELKKADVGVPTTPKRSRQDEQGVKALWKAIDDISIHESNKNFLRLMLIFANRSNELRLAKKADFDLEKRVWTVPEENNKVRKKQGGAIRRAIPPLAEKIIMEQFAIWPNHTMMFPPVNTEQDRPMSANVPVDFGSKLADRIEELGFPRTTNHDMRRTARNIWESMGIPYHVAETMLGHKVHTGVQSHYLDYDYLKEQRDAYVLWSKVLGNKAGE